MRCVVHAILLCDAKSMHPSGRTNKSFCSRNHFISILARNALNNASFLGYSKGHLLVYKQLQQLCSLETLLWAQNKAWEQMTSSGVADMGQDSEASQQLQLRTPAKFSFFHFLFEPQIASSFPIPFLSKLVACEIWETKHSTQILTPCRDKYPWRLGISYSSLISHHIWQEGTTRRIK